jgi:hypothetical protein
MAHARAKGTGHAAQPQATVSQGSAIACLLMQVLSFGNLSPVFPVKCEPEGRHAGNFQVVAAPADLESLPL